MAAGTVVIGSGLADMPPDRHAMLHAIFVALDADKSDYVDADEFKSIFTEVGEKYADERMAEIDNVRDRGDSDGQLTAAEFCSFMLEYHADLHDKVFREKIAEWEDRISKSHRKLLLRRVFSRMDVDRSGGVSIEEFKALGEEDLGANNSQAFFKWIDNAEGNSDGVLTADEWVPFVLETEVGSTDEEFQQLVDDWMEILERKRRVTILRQVFMKMDADSSGEVDLSEFMQLQAEGEDAGMISTVYEWLDNEHGNGDGLIQLDEWLTGMRKIAEDLPEPEFEAEVAKWNKVLTANQRQVWRSCYARGHAASFVTASRAAGATHALFVVNGNTAPGASGGGGDLARKLTDRGSAQCMVARDEWFGRLPVRKAILTSPASRAVETALHMSGQAGLLGAAESEQPLLRAPKLHSSGAGQLCQEIFSHKGACPLSTLLDAEGGETAFGLYAEATCEELASAFRADFEKPKGEGHTFERETYIAAFGHTGFLNATAYAVATAAGMDAEALDALLGMDLGEAEGILVPLYGKGKEAIHLKRPL